jgi:hypothetical protein
MADNPTSETPRAGRRCPNAERRARWPQPLRLGPLVVRRLPRLSVSHPLHDDRHDLLRPERTVDALVVLDCASVALTPLARRRCDPADGRLTPVAGTPSRSYCRPSNAEGGPGAAWWATCSESTSARRTPPRPWRGTVAWSWSPSACGPARCRRSRSSATMGRCCSASPPSVEASTSRPGWRGSSSGGWAIRRR